MAVTDYAVSGGATPNESSGGAQSLYVGLQGRLVADATRTKVAQQMSRGGSVTNLRVRVVSGSSTDDATLTLMVNGTASTNVTVTIPEDSSSTILESSGCEDFDVDDALSWRINLPSGSSSVTLQWIACEIGEGCV